MPGPPVSGRSVEKPSGFWVEKVGWRIVEETRWWLQSPRMLSYGAVVAHARAEVVWVGKQLDLAFIRSRVTGRGVRPKTLWYVNERSN